jgi:hypothetical protein
MNSGQNNVPYLNMVHDHDMFRFMWVAKQKAEKTNKGKTP